MAQNITLLGASYSDVPAVDLPKTGGGTARFTDVTDTTAAAADVSVGKYFFSASGILTLGANSGGGGGAAISIVDEPLAGGGTAKHITGVDISNDTVDAAHLAQGYTAHNASGTAIVGTMSGATLTTKTITANGTYNASSDSADGYSSVTVNVSGGASNVVTGTFTGTTTGAAMSITLSYSGSGYPMAVSIYPSEGTYNPSGSFYSTIQRYGINSFFLAKSIADATPTYASTGTNNQAQTVLTYKSSDSNAASYSRTGYWNAQCYRDDDAAANQSGVVRLRSATQMSVFIASDSYGFIANVPYTYHVIYSA